MTRIRLVATREFVAAMTNRAFVIGLLLVPVLALGVSLVLPRLITARNERIRGRVAVIDPTGAVAADLRRALTPEAIAARREEATARALAEVPAAIRDAAGSSAQAIEGVIGLPADLEVVERPEPSDLDAGKRWLTEATTSGLPHLALVVVSPNAVVPDADGRYGSYEVYVSENVPDRVESTLYEGLREAILNARLEARSMDRRSVEAMMRLRRPTSTTVTERTERATDVRFRALLPFAFAGLLVFAILIGGQALLTSTVEEKSSRVIEVLLSALSPFELMAGKILGQMAVSLVVLALYLGAGLLLLASGAMLGLLDPMLIVYLAIFFVISYLLFAAVFGAIGAAVNEMREAQALITPVMFVLMSPWLLGPAISRDPSSALSVTLSFIPPVNTFAMMIRLGSIAPPPAWQVWLTIVVGLASAVAATWVAAKVFRVGLLMHGTPPGFRTLVRWVRQA